MSSHDFKVGDRCRITKPGFWSTEHPVGTEFTVTEVFGTSVRTGLDYDGGKGNLHVDKHSIEKVVLPRLEPGSRYRILESYPGIGFRKGQEVTIVKRGGGKFAMTDVPYALAEDGHLWLHDLYLTEGRVEKIETPALKVGDWVIPSEFEGRPGFCSFMRTLVGKPGQVSCIEENGTAIVHGWWWPLYALTPTTAPVVRPEVGDWVITDEYRESDRYNFVPSMAQHVGAAGEVTEVTDHGVEVHGWWWPFSAVTPTEDPEPAATPASEPASLISMDKTYRTRDGQDVRVLCVDGPGEYPVIALVGDGANNFTAEGRFLGARLFHGEHPLDLIEYAPPVEPAVVYVAHYPDRSDPWGGAYERESTAIYGASSPNATVRRFVEDLTYEQP